MWKIVTVSALALGMAACAPINATSSAGTRSAGVLAEGDYQVFGPGDFQSFVKNRDGDAPLCARIASEADWDRYFGAAAVMGPMKPFGPPAALWTTHNTYLLARHANGGGGNIEDILKVRRVERGAGSVKIETAFAAPATGSFQVTTYVLVALPKPVSGTVEFREQGRAICSVRA
jgi:hypothetical protein